MTDAEGTLVLPSSLSRLRGEVGGTEWLAALPGLVASIRREWGLTLETPYPYAFASLALRARTRGGTPVVLKLQFPDRESRAEGAALAALGGRGAVRLLEQDPARRALLLERCEPGGPLLEAPLEQRLAVFEELLPESWVAPPEPVGTLAAEAAWWRGSLEASWRRTHRALPRPLLDAAIAALAELPEGGGQPVLLNQDLHAGNVLRAQRRPWLVIDPKPLAGDRAFALAPVLRDVGREDLDAVVPALDRLSTRLGLDRDRCRRWALAQTVAWGFDGAGVDPLHAAVARVLAVA